MKLFKSTSRITMSLLANTVLTAVVAVIATCGIGLTALYLIKYVDETPAMKSLQCMVGISHAECPRYGQEMDDLKAKLKALAKQTAKAEGKLANLRAIETAIDEVTLFATHNDPNSAYKVTTGTVYSKLLEPDLSPRYFCYISLNNGEANESRNLYIRNNSGSVEINADTLRKAAVSTETLAFARSVCKPFLIGGEK